MESRNFGTLLFIERHIPVLPSASTYNERTMSSYVGWEQQHSVLFQLVDH